VRALYFATGGATKKEAQRATTLAGSARILRGMPAPKNDAIDALVAQGDVNRLAELAESSDKETSKAARRGLHTLRTRGVKTPEAKKPVAQASIPRPLGDVAEAWTCVPDANGERLVVAIVPAPGGDFHVVTAHVSDERGLLQMAFGRGPRKHAREVRRNFELSGGFAADVPLARAAELIEAAYQLTLAAGKSPPPDFAAARRVLPRVTIAADAPHAALAEVPPAAPEALDRDHQELLHHLPTLSRWVPGRAQLNELEEKLNDVVTSKILVDGPQRQRAWQDVIDAAIGRVFDETGRRRWQRRLYDAALVYAAAGHAEEASALRAQGDRLTEASFDPLNDAFARLLVEKVTRGQEGRMGAEGAEGAEGSAAGAAGIVTG
jgi:hypothetical protein